jgi:hypothetical protein
MEVGDWQLDGGENFFYFFIFIFIFDCDDLLCKLCSFHLNLEHLPAM